MWPDGRAHLTADVLDPSDPDGAQLRTTTALALVSEEPESLLGFLVAPEVAADLGLEVVTLGAIVVSDEPLDDAALARLAGAAYQVDPLAQVWRDDPPQYQGARPITIAALVAASVALLATVLATGLAGSHIEADLATMHAIGGAPRTRRRIAGAQAWVIAVTGAVLGAVAGLVLGGVVVVWQRTQLSAWSEVFPFVVPWQMTALVLAIPVVAYLTGYGLTRQRLPMVRRLAE